MQFIIEIILHGIFEVIICSTGSYIRWNLLGRKGKFSKFFTRGDHETSDMVVGLIFWLLLIGIVVYFITNYNT